MVEHSPNILASEEKATNYTCTSYSAVASSINLHSGASGMTISCPYDVSGKNSSPPKSEDPQ